MIATEGRVFVAGAGGVIGRRLVPLLRRSGYRGVRDDALVGARRASSSVRASRRSSSTPTTARRWCARWAASSPGVIIHQLTDLSGGFAPEQIDETRARNARLRTEGDAQSGGRRARGRRAPADRAEHRLGLHTRAASRTARPIRSIPTQDGVTALESAVLERAADRGRGATLRLVLRPGRERRSRPAAPACTSTRPRRPPCWRSSAARRARTTSPSRALTRRPKRRDESSAGTPTFGLT